MIERNVGDDADLTLNHIGGIETSAHADFEHSDSHFLSREIFESHGRQHFEKAGMPWQFAILDQPLGSACDYIVQ